MRIDEQIAESLRADIVSGRLAAGRRLPTRDALRRRFGASLATVQGGIDHLVTDGFVRVGPRKHGTFVSERPPHLHHYKVIFPYAPEERGEFWKVLHDEALSMDDATDRSFSFFYGFGGHRDLQAYRELIEDVSRSRVAGLIFASGAAEFQGTPVLDQPNVPRVALAAPYELRGVPKLVIDHASFFDRALSHLARCGRGRVAVLFAAFAGRQGDGSPMMDAFRRQMAAHGLAVNPLWEQHAHLWSPPSARNIVRLLLQGARGKRPDALLVADDNLLAAASQGVMDAGLADPAALTVVSLSNFPARIEAAVPVVRIGFDVKDVLERASRIIDGMRDGHPAPPEVQGVFAVTEEEYEHARGKGRSIHHEHANDDTHGRAVRPATGGSDPRR